MLIFLQFPIGTRAVVRPTSSRHRPFCFHNFVFLLNCLFVLYRPIGNITVAAVMRHLVTYTFTFYQKYATATRISVCVIAVSKSHEFLLKVRRLSSFFSTMTPTPSRRRVVNFSTMTEEIRLRRRFDVFYHDVGH